MRNSPLSLIAITGFLGSGKTSILETLLKQSPYAPEKSALVINDFGPVNIDATLLGQQGLAMQNIAGGCVCCTSYKEMIDALLELASNLQLEIIWMETSGLAAPEEMIDHLTAPALHGQIQLRQMIQVVDAAHFPASWRHRATEEEQLQYADWIILNKVDLIDESKKQKALEKIRRMNAKAELSTATQGETDFSKLWEKTASSLQSHGHHHHHHDAEASTFFYSLKGPIARAEFENWLSDLPKEVYRAKGFVRFRENPDQLFTFQQVAEQKNLLLLPVEMDAPLGMVFIGPKLDIAALKQQLDLLWKKE